jgi:hypothetical protein
MEYRALAAVVCLGAMLGCSAIERKLREPGEQLATFPGSVADEYDCAQRRLPFIEVEQAEIIPSRVRAGGRLNHRFVYVMCPERASGVIEGTLYTSILFKGKTVHSDDVQWELQPGRWVVDSFISLPGLAKPGMYALSARFESQRGGFSFQSDFLVEAPRPLFGGL